MKPFPAPPTKFPFSIQILICHLIVYLMKHIIRLVKAHNCKPVLQVIQLVELFQCYTQVQSDQIPCYFVLLCLRDSVQL